MNIPNRLTIYRMLITPVFLAALLTERARHSFLFAALVFSAGALTDAFDGRIARKYNQVTVIGKLLDPVADKLMTTSALLGFMKLGLCSVWIAVIIISREFAVMSVRLVASAQGVIIPANIWGKLKTVCQMIFTILIMLLGEIKTLVVFDTLNLPFVSNALLWVTALLTAVSGIVYVLNSRKIINFSS